MGHLKRLAVDTVYSAVNFDGKTLPRKVASRQLNIRLHRLDTLSYPEKKLNLNTSKIDYELYNETSFKPICSV
jgi:hypothetical protein